VHLPASARTSAREPTSDSIQFFHFGGICFCLSRDFLRYWRINSEIIDTVERRRLRSTMVLEAFAYVILNFVRGYNTICSFMHIVRKVQLHLAVQLSHLHIHRYIAILSRLLAQSTSRYIAKRVTQVIYFVTIIIRLTTLKRYPLLYSCKPYTMARLEPAFYCTRLLL